MSVCLPLSLRALSRGFLVPRIPFPSFPPPFVLSFSFLIVLPTMNPQSSDISILLFHRHRAKEIRLIRSCLSLDTSTLATSSLSLSLSLVSYFFFLFFSFIVNPIQRERRRRRRRIFIFVRCVCMPRFFSLTILLNLLFFKNGLQGTRTKTAASTQT